MVKSSQTKQKIRQRIIETSSQMMVKGSVREFPPKCPDHLALVNIWENFAQMFFFSYAQMVA